MRVGASRFEVGPQAGRVVEHSEPNGFARHAELTVIERGMLLRALGSTNGTFSMACGFSSLARCTMAICCNLAKSSSELFSNARKAAH